MTPAEWIGAGTLLVGAVGFLYGTHRTSIQELRKANSDGRTELQHTIKEMFISRLDRSDHEGELRDNWLQELSDEQKETSGKVIAMEVTVANHSKQITDLEKNCRANHTFRQFPGGAL